MIDMWSNLASGGLLGLVGSLCNKGFTLFAQANEHKLQQVQQEYELKKLKLMQKMQQRTLRQQRQMLHEESETLIRNASYLHDSQIGKASRWVIDSLRLVRPLLTLGLVLLTALIWCGSAQEDPVLRKSIVDAVLFCTTAALTWWFGDRAGK